MVSLSPDPLPLTPLPGTLLSQASQSDGHATKGTETKSFWYPKCYPCHGYRVHPSSFGALLFAWVGMEGMSGRHDVRINSVPQISLRTQLMKWYDANSTWLKWLRFCGIF